MLSLTRFTILKTGQAPLDQPQPGTFGGGRIPLGDDDLVREARNLVPHNRAPVAVFPPFSRERTYPAIAVIWDETPLHILRKRSIQGQVERRRSKRGIMRDLWHSFKFGVTETLQKLRRYAYSA